MGGSGSLVNGSGRRINPLPFSVSPQSLWKEALSLFPLRRVAERPCPLPFSSLTLAETPGEMRSEPSLPLSHQENVSPAPQGGQSYVILARRWLPPLSAGRCLDVSVQSWHWVWSLQQPHVRKHCRSLIKLNIRQRDTRLICLTYGFRHFSFVLFCFISFFPFFSALSEDELYLCVSSKRLR